LLQNNHIPAEQTGVLLGCVYPAITTPSLSQGLFRRFPEDNYYTKIAGATIALLHSELFHYAQSRFLSPVLTIT
jgi:hypothetical protein